MFQLNRALWPLVIVVGVTTSGLGSEPLYGPRPGVLVLRNGGVLRGTITRVGDRYLVTMDRNGEVRVPVENVELACDDLDQAYLEKRKLIDAGGIEQHLQLAEWCLRERLLSRAAEELISAMQLDPHHPGVGTLERRLQFAARPIPRESAAPAAPRPVSAATTDLDDSTITVSEPAVAMFTRVVQPLLLNSCGSNGCHGPASNNQFRLMHASLGRTVTRRTTMKNLHAALRFVDRERPAASLLLALPIASHGGLGRPIFGPSDASGYGQLVRWVTAVSLGQGETAAPPSLAVAKPLLWQTAAPPVGVYHPPATSDTPAQSNHPAVDVAEPRAGADAPAVEGAVPDSPPDRTARDYVPRDPFDPEIFNRRFLPAKQ